jgi:hypothetical protein
MKIAICGSDDESRSNLIKSFISQWPMYATPADNIFNSDLDENNIPENLKESFSLMNDIEKQLFGKILLIETQLEKYSDQRYLLFNGSGIDILVNALILCENELISEEFVEKIIYHNKKILRLLDVVYFIPNDNVNEDSLEPDKLLESVYWNFYDNYQSEFNNSPFFDHKNCASILLLESNSPINEIKMLIDKNGNLEGTSQGGDDIIDTKALTKALKSNPRLLEAALESLKSNKPQNVGSITF